MKKICAFLIGLAVIAASAPAPASAPAQIAPQGQIPGGTRSVIFSLEPGESIMEEESTMCLDVSAKNIVLLLTKSTPDKGPYVVVKDGQRSAPIPDFKQAMAAAYGDENDAPGPCRDCAVYKPGDAPETAQFDRESQGEAGETLTFQGKSFGPFALVYSSRVTPDGARGYFTASNKDKAWFGCTDGRKVSFGGIPSEFKFSPDGRNAVVYVEGNQSLDDMQKLASIPPDKQAAAFAEIEKRYLYTIDGKKFGPFDKDFSASSVWFPAGTNDFYFRDHDQVYRNGVPFLKSESFDDCAFYPSADGKFYVFFTYENVIFSDGLKFPPALDIRTSVVNGRTVYKWISLENKKDIVVYTRTM